ncbi:MAG: hypothetical protein U1E54_03385 [Candidatus Levybacteria bacterium]|nr:hypothetical protein [Candidatus Levybacteria bacterium]
MNRTKIYQVKKGYNNIASFDDLQKATNFFAELVKASGKTLLSINGKGNNKDLKAHYWGTDVEFAIAIKEATIYPSKKEAEFAVFETGEGDSESLAD